MYQNKLQGVGIHGIAKYAQILPWILSRNCENVCRGVTVNEGSVAEWSARRTRNPAVPGSSPALATCWICARSSRV